MDSLDIHPASYLKRNLSFNDTLTGPLRQRNGFAYNSSSYRRKQRMRYQRFAQRYKSVAILGTGIACVLLFALSGLRNVVIVAGHSVLRYTDAATVEENDSWYLEPYMEIPGQAKTFVDHIRMGVEAAAADPLSILLFSGGTTKVKAGPMTEAQSYWTVAEKMDWFGMADVRHRAFTENFARDSLENLLFSICRFNELTSDYPETMTVVSYRFKEQRFAGIHREALRFPRDRFTFFGSDYPSFNLAKATEGEKRVYDKFKVDPYGVHGELKSKLYNRDPFVQGARYTNSCPEMQPLMRYSGRDLYSGRLPWTTPS